MVSINFTILVILAMFLGFLWAMHRFIFNPVLNLTDERDAKMAEDRQVARDAARDAEFLEDKYNAHVAKIHRDANTRITKARRAAQEEHQAKVDAFKKRAESELRELRAALKDDIKGQESKFGGLSDEIAAAIAKQLELK